jgi:hypothetical protein
MKIKPFLQNIIVETIIKLDRKYVEHGSLIISIQNTVFQKAFCMEMKINIEEETIIINKLKKKKYLKKIS